MKIFLFGTQLTSTEPNTSESIMFYSYNEHFFIILIFILINNSSGKDKLEDLIEKGKIYTQKMYLFTKFSVLLNIINHNGNTNIESLWL